MAFTATDWIALVLSSLFAYVVFCNISSKAGYPRWHGLAMLVPVFNVVEIVIFTCSASPIENKVLELQLRDPNH